MLIERNKLLAPLTTFRIGGRAKFFVEAKSIDDVRDAVQFAKKNDLRIFILGGGSNVLISDKGFDGLVIKISMKGLKFSDTEDSVILSTGAGEIWDDVVGKAVRRNLGGIENLSLIPGTAGAALYQNIGAYGVELKDSFENANVLDIKSGKIKMLLKKDCELGYRDSVFQHKEGKKYVILSVRLRLSKEPKPNIYYPDLIKYFENKKLSIAEVRKAVIKIRRAKLVYPDELGTAGSFFKNPTVPISSFKVLISEYPDIRGRDLGNGLVKLSAAQLIEKAGWKGHRSGNVGVSDKHALVLVSYNRGKAVEIVQLSDKISKDIKTKFRVALEPEVRIIG